jgi:hypothetical protein
MFGPSTGGTMHGGPAALASRPDPASWGCPPVQPPPAPPAPVLPCRASASVAACCQRRQAAGAADATAPRPGHSRPEPTSRWSRCAPADRIARPDKLLSSGRRRRDPGYRRSETPRPPRRPSIPAIRPGAARLMPGCSRNGGDAGPWPANRTSFSGGLARRLKVACGHHARPVLLTKAPARPAGVNFPRTDESEQPAPAMGSRRRSAVPHADLRLRDGRYSVTGRPTFSFLKDMIMRTPDALNRLRRRHDGAGSWHARHAVLA